jgi:hypothetical protein
MTQGHRYLCLLAALSLESCAGGSSGSIDPALGDGVTALKSRAASSGGFVYVSNLLTVQPPYVGAVDYYPVGSNGNIPPAGVITGPNTMLTDTTGIVVDGGGEIFVANSDANTIVGFPASSDGNVTPNVVIAGLSTGLASPVGLAIDKSDNIYVANCGSDCNYGPPGSPSIEEFAPGSNGNVAPIRTIAGTQTQLSGGHVNGIALDGRGAIYVARAPSAVNVYSPKARGNVGPSRVITGALTQIDNPIGVAAGRDGLYVNAAYNGYINVFSHRATGDIAPRHLLYTSWPKGGPSNGSSSGLDIAPDGTLYVTGYTPLIAQFAPAAKRHTQPLTEIYGANTGLVVPTFVYVR